MTIIPTKRELLKKEAKKGLLELVYNNKFGMIKQFYKIISLCLKKRHTSQDAHASEKM